MTLKVRSCRSEFEPR